MHNVLRSFPTRRSSDLLSTEEQAMLPASPAGEIELTDAQLAAVYGASDRSERKEANDNDEREDQKGAATYDNKIGEWSVAWCTAGDKGELDDKNEPAEN